MRLSVSLDTETGRITFFTNENQPLPNGAARGFEFIKAANADGWTLTLTDKDGKTHDFSRASGRATAHADGPSDSLSQAVANYLSRE